MTTEEALIKISRACADAHKEQIGANQMSNVDRSLDLEKQVASIKQQIINLQKEKARFSNMVKDNAAAPKQVDDINYQILVLEKQLGATQEQIASNNKSFNSQKIINFFCYF